MNDPIFALMMGGLKAAAREAVKLASSSAKAAAASASSSASKRGRQEDRLRAGRYLGLRGDDVQLFEDRARPRRWPATSKVSQWEDEVEIAIDAARVQLDQIGRDELIGCMLAIVHVESGGDPALHRLGSQFYGLTQVGRAAGIDAGLPDKGRATAKVLHGDGQAALNALAKIIRRYSAYITDEASIAVMWKGGAGTAKRVHDMRKRGISLHDACRAIEQHEDSRKRIPRLWLYCCEFAGALSVWGADE